MRTRLAFLRLLVASLIHGLPEQVQLLLNVLVVWIEQSVDLQLLIRRKRADSPVRHVGTASQARGALWSRPIAIMILCAHRMLNIQPFASLIQQVGRFLRRAQEQAPPHFQNVVDDNLELLVVVSGFLGASESTSGQILCACFIV